MTAVVPPARPSLPTMLWRGARRRCAWCGGRSAFFTSWFRKQDTCRTCGITWRRGYEGFELGALAISAVVCMGLLIVAMTVGIVATLPDIAVVPLLVILGVGAIVLPIVVYPLSYTLWQAVDLAMHPPQPGDGAPPARNRPRRRERCAVWAPCALTAHRDVDVRRIGSRYVQQTLERTTVRRLHSCHSSRSRR